MTTKTEMIEQLKAEYPTLKNGDDERGYQDLSAADYQATIEKWADAKLKREAAAEQAAIDKAALLAKLGMSQDDLKTLLS